MYAHEAHHNSVFNDLHDPKKGGPITQVKCKTEASRATTNLRGTS